MSKVKLDKVIVYDLELTCWDNNNKPPPGEQQEIIEIGVVNLDVNSGQIFDKTSYIIKPKKSKISSYCKNLTGITQEQVNKGMLLEHATNKIIKDFAPLNRPSCSFGQGDRVFLSRECRDKNARFPFSENYIDISVLFALKYNKKSGGIGLVKALSLCDEEFEGREHSGADDAYNTAKLLWKVIQR